MFKFVKSSSSNDNKFIHNFNEVCFIGRSNVGKSSLINAISNNSKLAKVSKMPGRTQLINYFSSTVNNLIVVDLPGYGFANISKSQQEKMFSMIEEYFQKEKPIYVFILIDSRRGIMEQDEKIINYLLSIGHKIILILTKIDKAKQSEIARAIKHEYFRKMQYFYFSIQNEKYIKKLQEFLISIDK